MMRREVYINNILLYILLYRVIRLGDSLAWDEWQGKEKVNVGWVITARLWTCLSWWVFINSSNNDYDLENKMRVRRLICSI